jgi:serine protease inhibitor
MADPPGEAGRPRGRDGAAATGDGVAGDGVAGDGAAARADDAFGADLLGALRQPGRNVVYSPASIAAVLRMLLTGARGDTERELAAVLHLAGRRDAASGLRLLSAGLAQLASGDLTLRTPNTMWMQAGLPLEPEFSQAMTGVAQASVREASFATAPEQVRQEINALIEEQTAGKIAEILVRGQVTRATRLALANAVYLKAPWLTPFEPQLTHDAPFRLASGDRVTVPMMRQTTRLGYLAGDGYQAVLLPYVGGRLALAVIVPDGALAPCEDKLARHGTAGLLAGAGWQQVELGLPRFRQELRLDLKPALQRLSVESAFGAAADFSGITTSGPLWVDVAAHMAYVDVNEQGTEAAAATVAGMRTLAAFQVPPPVELTVDRPFLFAIIDTQTSLPLFLGRVARPGSVR